MLFYMNCFMLFADVAWFLKSNILYFDFYKYYIIKPWSLAGNVERNTLIALGRLGFWYCTAYLLMSDPWS